MFSRIWPINVILLLLFAFLGLKAYGVWFQGNAGDKTLEMVVEPARKAPEPLAALYEKKIPPGEKYDALIALNLFSPERTETILEAPKPDGKSKKLSASEQKNIKQYLINLTLYGLVITNDSAEALVSYPVAKPVLNGRKRKSRNVKRLASRQTKWVKVGDTLDDFKVVSITPDRVLLKVGDQSFDLLLYDKGKLKKRAAAKPKTGPNVVGVSVKLKTGSKVAATPAKTPAVKTKSQSAIPFPTQKKASGTAATKSRTSQK